MASSIGSGRSSRDISAVVSSTVSSAEETFLLWEAEKGAPNMVKATRLLLFNQLMEKRRNSRQSRTERTLISFVQGGRGFKGSSPERMRTKESAQARKKIIKLKALILIPRGNKSTTHENYPKRNLGMHCRWEKNSYTDEWEDGTLANQLVSEASLVLRKSLLNLFWVSPTRRASSPGGVGCWLESLNLGGGRESIDWGEMG